MFTSPLGLKEKLKPRGREQLGGKRRKEKGGGQYCSMVRTPPSPDPIRASFLAVEGVCSNVIIH